MPLITDLDKVHWQAPAKTAAELTAAGIVHGFYGVGDKAPPFHSTRQVHGTRVVEATAARTSPTSTTRIEADGIFTMTKGETLAVRTADCLPVLMIAPDRLAIAIHAGWRGLTAGILSCGIGTAEDHGIQAGELRIAIGPAISRDQFEVGEEVVQALYKAPIGLSDAEADLCVSKGQADRWHVDLTRAAALSLIRLGVKPESITVIQACTKKLNQWHSYRREGKGAPSNWSWITL